MIPGFNGQLVKADEEGITARLPTGKTEVHPWDSLSERSVERLLRLVVRENDPNDCIAAGLLALASGNAPAAEKHLERAKALGASVASYLDPLAAAAFKDAEERLKKKRPNETLAALSHLKTKYGKSPWYGSHEADVEALERGARAMIAEAEAEKLYAQAAALYQKKELFDLKPIIEKLKNDYPATKAVTDGARKPSVAEMAEAVANLGKFVTVRKDGKGDFKSVQAAINSAPPSSLIEIQDSGTYEEVLVINKKVTLRGKKGAWPIITDRKLENLPAKRALVWVLASAVTIEQVIMVARHGCLCARCPSLLVRRALLLSEKPTLARTDIWVDANTRARLEQCVTTSLGTSGGHIALQDCLVLSYVCSEGEFVAWNSAIAAHVLSRSSSCVLRSCTVRGSVSLSPGHNVVVDCIVGGVVPHNKATALVEHTDAFGARGFIALPKVGRGCFSKDPQFRDPKNFDYRLKKTSPCRGKASDGGDIGCRYTPEMLEMLKLAQELRKKGIIKF